MEKEVDTLKPYEFNKEFFEDIKGTDYEGLKEDIKQNGIKVDLHVTKSNTILCGHQRWNIAKEIGLKDVPVKIVDIDEKDKDKVKLYVINDNLLRRHLTKEQRAKLHYEKYKIVDKDKGLEQMKLGKPLGQNVPKVDVYQEIADTSDKDRRTIVRDIQYGKLIEKSPELKTKKYSDVINNYEIKEDKVIRKNTRVEIDVNRINPYDGNMFHFCMNQNKDFGKDVLCVDVTHGENDIRKYKEFYPTILHVCTFLDNKGKEFSLRKYAEVQNFPKDYKFMGTQNEIKRQIGEAVSPKMGEYIIKKYITGKSYIELFAGCGGFSVGAHKLKKECKWCNDFNKYSGYSFKLNFPKTEVFVGDVQDIDEKKIHKEVGEIDFIMGGPPCQGFSSAGQRLGLKEDSRNQLYLEFVRFVNEFKPKQFIMENVKEIENYKKEITEDFGKIGYDVKIEKVNGLDIGMKQKRIRVFFIGNLKGGRN